VRECCLIIVLINTLEIRYQWRGIKKCCLITHTHIYIYIYILILGLLNLKLIPSLTNIYKQVVNELYIGVSLAFFFQKSNGVKSHSSISTPCADM
jgi:hypothetical protein